MTLLLNGRTAVKKFRTEASNTDKFQGRFYSIIYCVWCKKIYIILKTIQAKLEALLSDYYFANLLVFSLVELPGVARVVHLEICLSVVAQSDFTTIVSTIRYHFHACHSSFGLAPCLRWRNCLNWRQSNFFMKEP